MQKSTQNRSWRRLGAPWGLLRASWCLWGRLESFVGAAWGRLGEQHGSNLAPKTEPKSIKNRSQNQSIFESLLGLDFYGILVDFGRKMEPSWHPDGIKNRCQLRRMIFWKNLVFPKEKQWFWRFWRLKLAPKIHQKSIKKGAQLGKASWHRFFMDFGGFWRPSWAKLAWKIEPKSIKKPLENKMKKRRHLGGILEASWGVLEAFWGVLGGLEPSWGRLESILKRLGGVLGSSWRRPGAVLGTSWSVLGPLGASCGRLGSVSEVSCVWFSGQSGLNWGMLSRI